MSERTLECLSDGEIGVKRGECVLRSPSVSMKYKSVSDLKEFGGGDVCKIAVAFLRGLSFI